ncbi:RNA-directed DNA polymerase, eukaryota, reverse transcriptase zinc-binding domain protein [Tanacetum coccineum]
MGEALKPVQEKLPNQNVPSKPASKSQPVTNIISSKMNDTSSLLTSNSFESLMNNDTENMFVSSSTIVMDGWKWTSNEMACSKGSRIILGWNPDIVNVVIISFNDQVMHVCIVFKAKKKELFCLFIYAHNRYIQRRDLWNNLSIHKRYIRNRPWYILGDFNMSLSADESSAGSSYINTGMQDFKECAEDMEVADVNSTGLKFTWNQKLKGNDGILKKIDRIMANLEFNYFLFKWLGGCVRFFSRIEYLIIRRLFKDIVTNGWSISVSGFWMYKVVKRLKGLKKPLRKLLYDKGNLHENVKKLRHELDEVQKSLDGDPSNLLLREEEAAYLKAFQDALIEEERFLFQKAKVEWLKLGDANTAYFHKVVKSQAARNRIDSITNMDGTLFDGDQVPIAFINHYTDFIGQSGTTSHVDLSDLFCNRLSNEDALSMIDEVSDKEIREGNVSLGDYLSSRSCNGAFTLGLDVAVLTCLAVLIDVAALGELCLVALTGISPDFVATTVGTQFLLGYG